MIVCPQRGCYLYHMMTEAQKLSRLLGRSAIAAALGVVPSSVSNASKKGVFPAAWYLVVRSLAHEQGLDCPVEAFAFAERVEEEQRDLAA